MMKKILKRFFGKIERQAKFTKRMLEEKPEIPNELVIKQYPKNLTDTNPTIFDPNTKYEYITPRHKIENTFFNDASQLEMPEEPTENKQKFAKVALIGAPNSGKSSIINKLVEQKLNAVSKISNTTVENSENIKTYVDDHTQVVFFDTPGMKNKTKKNESLSNGWKAVQEADFIFLVVDCLKRIDSNLVEILTKLQNMKVPHERIIAKNYLNQIPTRIDSLDDKALRVNLVMNKVDLCNNKRRLLSIRDELEDYLHFENIFITSAETGFGLESLEGYLIENAEFGDWEFSRKTVSEKTEVEIIEEMARNAVYNKFWKELPYKMPVKLEELSFRSDRRAQLKIKIYVHKRVQRLMLIGKGGQGIKYLRRLISKDFVERYGIKCDVYIRVGMKKVVEQGGDILFFQGDEDIINKGELKELKAHRTRRARERKNQREDTGNVIEKGLERMRQEFEELLY